MRIEELASSTGITTKTIRSWESTGLLTHPAYPRPAITSVRSSAAPAESHPRAPDSSGASG